jgi:hypothetical protein
MNMCTKCCSKVLVSTHLGSRNGLIPFTLILMGKIVSVYEQFGLRTASRNGLSSQTEAPLYLTAGLGSLVSIATSYRLDGPGIESRWGRDFPHLSRPALGPTHNGYRVFPGGRKRPGRDANPSYPSSTEV